MQIYPIDSHLGEDALAIILDGEARNITWTPNAATVLATLLREEDDLPPGTIADILRPRLIHGTSGVSGPG